MMNLEQINTREIDGIYHKVLDYIIANVKKVDGSSYLQREIAAKINESEKLVSKQRGRDAIIDHQKRIIRKCLDTFQLNIRDNGTIAKIESSTIHNLQKLADRLAINLVDVSTPFQSKDEKLSAHNKILRKDRLEKILSHRIASNNRERFIAIVGVEASHIASDGYMPLHEEAKKKIKKYAIKKGNISEALIDEERERLEQTYRLDKNKFETYLLAISKFSRKILTDALKTICEYDYCLSLEYEILAHLLKHRFIDIVINFNYDEILDKAIEEEVNKGEYKFIFSDGHCPNEYEDFLVDNRLKQPVYVKPHGSISYRSTLRFTREDFLSIPLELRDTLNDLLSGDTTSGAPQAFLPLNLIIIGHSIVSFDFVNLLRNYLINKDHKNRTINLWIFNERDERSELRKIFENRTTEDSQIIERINFYYFPVDRKEDSSRANTLKTYLKKLWGNIENNFEDRYKPVGINRHILLDHIFKPRRKLLREIKEKPNKYLKSRFYTELIIAVLNSDGILNTRQILEDRAGKYFSLYQQKIQKDDSEFSLRKACDEIGLQYYKGFVKDTFTLTPPHLFHDTGGALFEHLYDKLLDKISADFKNNIVSKEDRKELIKCFRGIRQRNLLKITSDFTKPHDFMFASLKKDNILNTTLNWTFKFDEVVSKSKSWDLALAISEKGRFIRHCIKQGFLKDKKIELVLSSFDMNKKDFPDLSSDRQKSLTEEVTLLSDKLNFLPWYLHNRHLIILLKKLDRNTKDWRKDWRLVDGFYYENRMLSRRANPVRIDHKVDLEILLEIFANYWHRAREYTREKKLPKSVPIISTKEELDRYIQEILDLY